MPCKPNMPVNWAWRHDPNKSFISFHVIGLGPVVWTKYGLIISFSFKSIGCEMGLMDNGRPVNNKQIFVGLRYGRFIKKRTVCLVRWFNYRFERFNASLTTKQFIEMDQTGKFTDRRFDR